MFQGYGCETPARPDSFLRRRSLTTSADRNRRPREELDVAGSTRHGMLLWP